MSDPFSLSGRQALVTGSTRGIGLAIVRAMIARGAEVTLTGRKAETLAPVVSELQAHGARVRGIPCHQGDPAAIESLFAQLDAANAAPDIVVVNAATNPVIGGLVDVDLDAWKKILEVNLTGALLTARAALKRMLARQRGSIVFMASVAGIEPMDGLGAYSVSKAGLLGLMRGLAREVGPHGIRVNAIAPGLVETRFSQALFQDTANYQALIARTPLRRHGLPEDIAGVAVFLASDAAAWITGQTIVVDGGGRI